MKTLSGGASIVLLYANTSVRLDGFAAKAPLHPLAGRYGRRRLTQHPNLIDFAGPWAVFETSGSRAAATRGGR
jgi:hypothetical protein